MGEVITKERLTELSSLPRLNWRDILTFSGGEVPAEDVTAMDEYFSHFVLMPGSKCVNCDAEQGGLFGSFRWGLAHGEGSCRVCGYPARAIHYHVGALKRLEVILQYHPSELVPAEQEAEG